MSNVIRFPGAMRRNPGIHGLSAADCAATVALLEIDGAQQEALLACDATTLDSLLEGQAKIRAVPIGST